MTQTIHEFNIAHNLSGASDKAEKVPVRRLSSTEKKLIELLDRLDSRKDRLSARCDAFFNRAHAYCYWARDEPPIDYSQPSENFRTVPLQWRIASGHIPKKLLPKIRKGILAGEEIILETERKLSLAESLLDQKEKWAACRGYRPPIRKVLH
jgi:hypothetical protein